jgi:hypothetical protein
MACQRQDNEAVAAAELIAERGLEGLGDAVSMLNKEPRGKPRGISE